MAETRASLKKNALKKTVIFIVVIVGGFFLIRGFARFITNFDPEKEENFQELKLREVDFLVEEKMGEPDRVSHYQMESLPVANYEEIRDFAKKSGAVKYYYYENGMTTLYILGFDARRQICFKRKVSK